MENVIDHVQFGLFSREEVEALSEVEVTETAMYERNIPRDAAVNDLRMGTVDRRFCCNTCQKDVMTCVGHTGHLKLVLPVYHVGYIDMVLKVLRSVCFFCSALLVTDQGLASKGERRAGYSINAVRQHLTAMANAGKQCKICAHCHSPQPHYTRMGLAIRKDFGDAKFETPEQEEYAKGPLTAAAVFNILHHISADDLAGLGFAHSPKNAILHNLLVPPPIMRPTIMVSDGSRIRGQDDLTLKLQDILKQNRQLRQLLDDKASEEEVQRAYDLLQFHVAMYMNHDARSFQQMNMKASVRSSGQVRSIFFRLKGKKGRIRGNLMGKRCDFSSRTVITPDPYMPIDCIGVPSVMALKQTLSETVNQYNLAALTRCVRIGSGKKGGAHALIRQHPREHIFLGMFDAAKLRELTLHPGDTVERYLNDGDWILFNRQPSLHKQSIMGHRVKIIPGNTFRLPVCDTSPYNADFDGDEMNMHVCQNAAATVEIQEIMAVPHQIISAQSNKPIIGLVQDVLVGGYLLTKRTTFLRRDEMMALAMLLEQDGPPVLPPPTLHHPVQLWTGKQAASLALPAGLHFRRKVRNGSDDAVTSWLERCVIVQGGRLLCGSFCKQSLGACSGGLVHILHKDRGAQEAARFIVNMQRVVNRWLEGAGFSIGIGDCHISSTTHNYIQHIIQKLMLHIAELTKRKLGTVLLEAQTSTVLQSIINQTGRAALKHMDPDNGIFGTVTSGSKGSQINISQIMACVGQQSVEGQRINVDRGKLSCYTSKDRGHPRMHGFVKHSYFQGLTPQEYYFHAMGGREGLVDTAVKTAATGYISRRLVKVMESIQVKADRTIRTASQEIIQFVYGGDHMDATFLERIKMPYLEHAPAQLREHCQAAPPSGWAACHRRAWVQQMEREAEQFTTSVQRLQNCTRFTMETLDTDCHLPVHVQRLFQHARRQGSLAPAQRPWVHVQALLEEVSLSLACKASLLHGLCTASVLRWKWSDADVQGFCNSIRDILVKATIAPGEMVGALASSSIGEPCTQMTLNTFHSAGIATKNMTLGIPRFKELIDVSKKIKTPSLSIFLQPPLDGNQKLASLFATSIQHTMLAAMVESSQLLYEEEVWATAVAEDRELLELRQCTQTWQDEMEAAQLSSWVIRLVLSREHMESAGLTMEHVETAVATAMGDTLQVVASNQNMLQRVLRIRMYNLHTHMKLQQMAHTAEEQRYLEKISMQQLQNHLLDSVYLQGVPGIQRALAQKTTVLSPSMEPQEKWLVDTEGSNLGEILAMEGVDFTRTTSNDVLEVYQLFGIEAANQVLFQQIKHVLSFDASYVNDRHIQLLVDTMTFRGFVCPVSRHGMAKSSLGPLMRSSFEETVDVLLDAAVYSEKDCTQGVTENIMLGKLAPIGTGSVNLDESHPLCAMAPASKAPPPEPPQRFVGRRPKVAPAVVSTPTFRFCPSSPTLTSCANALPTFAPSSPRLVEL